MRLNEALKVYKTKCAIADALGISASAVSAWQELIPPLSAARLAKRSRGKLKFDPDDYVGWNSRKAG